MSDVLVLRRGGLGDTLLMLPTVRALRREHACRLHFAGQQEFTAVLAAFLAVDVAMSSEDLQVWALAGERRDAVVARLRRFARIVSDDAAVAAAAAAHTRVDVLPTLAHGTEPLGLQLAHRLGLVPRWPDDAWLLPPGAVAAGGPCVLAPGSGGVHKCWPRRHWLRLADALGAAALRIVVGPAELERDDPRRWPWPAGTEFLADVTAVELAQQLRAAGCFVGNDSGPTHLAAALGVPTVAIFGPTDPRVWAPVGPHVHVVGGGGRALAGVEVGEVAAAAARARSR
ncbi:MAG TPA: glycosyltransferase family 9 protein [Planctomycetota bacterium]|nr:glycosyltransferase family 9 protein [Planctomycetota bacterium]